MENREWRKKQSPERAIINSDGQRPSEKNAVSFPSRLKACHPNVYVPLRLGGRGYISFFCPVRDSMLVENGVYFH
ncbi:MAG: hypothetical protein LBG15_03945, partial [Dysgonamonadaceae bacterium]|nr:hypothetical protein [Dysgonamonadaceae bacterium]